MLLLKIGDQTESLRMSRNLQGLGGVKNGVREAQGRHLLSAISNSLRGIHLLVCLHSRISDIDQDERDQGTGDIKCTTEL